MCAQAKEPEKNTTPRYTTEELRAFVAEIEEKVVESNNSYFHSLVALNQMLRLPDAEKVFDEELKAQVRDLWVKLKSTGFEVNDPPLLFGLPEGFGEEVAEEEELDEVEFEEEEEEEESSPNGEDQEDQEEQEETKQ